MKANKELANITPACACGDYIEAGQSISIQSGQLGLAPAWWVECPNCHSTIGPAHRYPTDPNMGKAAEVGPLTFGYDNSCY